MDAWASKDKFVSLLFLDMKAAFPSIVVSKLIHNLQKAGIPKEYTDWYRKRLENCKTVLSFDDFKSDPFNVGEGVDQGCPLSSLNFIFYNSDVLCIADPRPRSGELSLGFLDDVVLVAKAESYEEANGKLACMMEKEGGALEWSREHHTEFELDKTALVCLSKQ